MEVALGARALLLEKPKLNIEYIWKVMCDSLGPSRGQKERYQALHLGDPVFSLGEDHLCAI